MGNCCSNGRDSGDNGDTRGITASNADHPWIKEDGEAPDVPLDNAVMSRLKQFKAMNNFKKVALRVIAGCLSEEEIMGLKEMFKGMDTDNSGTITLEELRQGLAKQGTRLSEYEVQQLMEAIYYYGRAGTSPPGVWDERWQRH
ncbi:hypothetical protein HID58_089283 [Brassica napus]|uniref:non-specific serine/threonine protein kinase n=1 Tax=Brassica napus TaxID=3708 RepID=A0ABQ7XYL3_BRANA|nr:hypothetical protein HID58_089283 [Brassica napus]